MNNLTSYEKLSKKAKRERDQARRADWCGVNPVTRKIESKKHYDRKRARYENRNDFYGGPFYLLENAAAQV